MVTELYLSIRKRHVLPEILSELNKYRDTIFNFYRHNQEGMQNKKANLLNDRYLVPQNHQTSN